MATRTCPNCGAPDYGTPFCVSCQKPFVRESGLTSLDRAPGATARPAGFARRLFAILLDGIILSIIADLVRFTYEFAARSDAGMLRFDAPMIISLCVGLIYFTLFTAEGGQTIGKRVFKIRVVLLNGKDISYGLALFRTLGYVLSFFFGTFLGFIWAFWDRRRQTWHDKAAGTVVIRI